MAINWLCTCSGKDDHYCYRHKCIAGQECKMYDRISADFDEDYEISTATSRRAEREMRSNRKIDGLIAQAERVQQLLEQALERDALFGDDSEYPIDSVLLFKRKFSSTGSKTYTYAAVKIGSNNWYITGQNSYAFTFDNLIDKHLIYATEVWFCRQWERVV